MPNPLPPALVLDDVELWRELSAADRALGELAGLGRSMANPDLFIRPFIRREAVLSSRIEGTRTSLLDLYRYEAASERDSRVSGPEDEADAREVLNYVRAMERGLELSQAGPTGRELMLEVHRVLVGGVRGDSAAPGQFRREQNWVGPPTSTVLDATYVPPPPAEMGLALERLEEYIGTGNSLPPLIRQALIHYQFEAIHPFRDGNGRVGRLLVSLLLVRWGLLPAPVLYLSAFLEAHRPDYYARLLGVTQRGEWRAWLLFFLQGVASQSADAVSRARRLHDLQADYHERIVRARGSALQVRLADLLFDSPVLSVPRASRLLGVPYPTAQRNIEKLARLGILEQIGDAKYGKSYWAKELLNITEPSG
ncbi:MAG: Fic family protein [bacterium]